MDPVAFRLFGIDIMWYGIIIAVGAIVGAFVASIQSKRFGFDFNKIVDLLIILVPLSIIGARLYYVLFYWGQEDSMTLKEVFYTRGGGLAIHGALIVGVIVTALYCKIKKINFWELADIMAPGVAIGQAIGRWGNYVNQEAYGSPTLLPWGIFVDGVKVHPTFLYESLWTLLIFVLLMVFTRKDKLKKGEAFLSYLILYSFGRMLIEELRTDSLMLGNIKIAQLVSLVIILISIVIIVLNRVKTNKSLSNGNIIDEKDNVDKEAEKNNNSEDNKNEEINDSTETEKKSEENTEEKKSEENNDLKDNEKEEVKNEENISKDDEEKGKEV